LPVVLGHEFGGTVEAIGPAVQGFQPGDRVAIPFNRGCGRCANCYSGRSNICLVGGGSGLGGFAELAVVANADVNLVHLPPEADAVTASALGCQFMTAYHGLVDRVRMRAGEWVAVFGAGRRRGHQRGKVEPRARRGRACHRQRDGRPAEPGGHGDHRRGSRCERGCPRLVGDGDPGRSFPQEGRTPPSDRPDQ
jgi:Alcohol dehydrogenase GroES-like domain